MKNGDFHSFHSFQKKLCWFTIFRGLLKPIQPCHPDSCRGSWWVRSGHLQSHWRETTPPQRHGANSERELWASTIFWHLRVRTSLLPFFGKILEDLRNQIHEMIWNIFNLVGGFNPSDKYEFVSWNDYSQYMESHNPAMFLQSPPTSNILWTNIQKSRNHSCPPQLPIDKKNSWEIMPSLLKSTCQDVSWLTAWGFCYGLCVMINLYGLYDSYLPSGDVYILHHVFKYRYGSHGQ